MEVKIYREPENESLIVDEKQLQEYYELTKKLGLKNELKETMPSLYIHINAGMEKLLKALCPRTEKAEDYNKSTIPLEVLKVLDFAKGKEIYEGYEIWHAEKEPDPLLIGWKYLNDEHREKGYTFYRHYYLMARWGDCSLDLDPLLKKGFDVLKTSLIDSSNEVLMYAKSVLESPDAYVRKHLSQNLNPPKINLHSGSVMGDLPF